MDIIVTAIIGILLGGGINVLADDLPAGRLPGPPKYHDGSPRPIRAWLGMTAFLFNLRLPFAANAGGNPEQGAIHVTRLAWRYPLCEVALAALMSLTYISWRADGVSAGQILIWQFQVAMFVLIALVDLEHKRVLIAPVLLSALLALAKAVLFPESAPSLASALAGGITGGITFGAIYCGGHVFKWIVRRSTKREMAFTVFGLGDVYLMAACGLIVGFPNVLMAMLLAIFFGGAGAVAHIVSAALRAGRYKPHAVLPYGPYILAATYVVLLLHQEIYQVFLTWR